MAINNTRKAELREPWFSLQGANFVKDMLPLVTV